MVQIGELAYKTRFDGRELTRGLLSTRQQMAAAKKLAEDTRTPLDRYRTGLDNLAAMAKRYTHVAERQVELSKQIEKQYLQEESAVRRLTRAERSRLELLQLPDQIKSRAAATPSAAAARHAANQQRGLQFVANRDAMFSGIDQQQTSGRAALAARLAAYKQGKSDRMSSMGNSRVFASMGASGIGADFHSSGPRSDAASSGVGSGFAFGAKAFVGGIAVAKVVQTAAAMKEFASESSRVYTSLEKTQAAFDVFTGSAAKTQSIIASMKQLSAMSGVTFSTMSEGAATMMSYGITTESTTEKLKQLATISRGDSERFKMMALAFGQVTAAGRLMGQETLQLINAGFNPLAEISRTTGRSMSDLKKDMGNGLITVEMVSNAFRTATSEGGRYNGMLEKIGETTAGAQAKSSAAWEQAKADVGAALAPLTKWKATMSEVFAQSVSDMAAPWKTTKTAIEETASAADIAKKKTQEAMDAQLKAQDRLAAAMKAEDERKSAMKDKGLAALPGMTVDMMAGGKTSEEDLKKFQRATTLMDEATKDYATREFSEYGDIKAVYSMLDAEVQKELEKVDALEQQNKLLADQKAEQEKNKQAGQAMAERNMTAAERYKKQLEDIAKLQGVGAIDARTGLRERLAIQSQLQQEMQAANPIPQGLLAGNAVAARSMSAGSAEAAKYMDELRALIDGTADAKKKDPQVKALEDIKKQNDSAIAETRRQTGLLEQIAKTSPKKAR